MVSGWSTTPEGQPLWRAEYYSAGAAGLRLHFESFQVADGEVLLRSPANPDFQPAPYTGQGLLGDGDFWSTLIPGDRVTVEFRPAAGPSAGDPPFRITQTGHFYDTRPKPGMRDILGCHVNATSAAQWQTPAASVALVTFQFTQFGSQFWTACTGSLVQNSTGRSYILTARHCIAKEEEARSVEAYFLFQSTNAAPLNYTDGYAEGFFTPRSLADRFPKVTGARLAVSISEAEGDATLLDLSSPAPAGAIPAPLNPAEVILATALTAIHHPQGSWQRLASGRRETAMPLAEIDKRVDEIFRPADYFYKVLETTGLTEGGSSGAPVFAADGRTTGVLSYGPEPRCGDPNRHGVYSRSSVLFPRLQPFLQAPPAGGCLLDTNAVNLTVGSSLQAGSFQISAPAGCAWAVAADHPHISVNPRAGSGSATIAYQLSANVDANPVQLTFARPGSISLIGEQRRLLHILQRGTHTFPVYSDVPATNPFAEEIKYLRQRSVVAFGCPGTDTFCPDAPTTRGQMAEFIIRAIYNGDNFFAPDTPQFTDVPSSHPGFRYIQKMAELRITAGCGATTYCPNESVTRGQMAVFIVRALQVKNRLDSRDPFTHRALPYFTDVPANHIFFNHIQRLRELGITAGCSANGYCPDAPNTRGQIAVFLTRGLFALWEGRSQ